MICPAEHDLTRALSVGADDALSTHLAECARCRNLWDGFEHAIRLARELPADVPSASHREELRTALLASTDTGAPRRVQRMSRVVWAAGGVAAAAIAALWLWRARPDDARSHASLHPSTGATFAVASGPPDEIVRLHDGVLAIDVDTLGPDDRFRVIVGDDEVEVRGTSFEVTAHADTLVGVRVEHGRVEVRPRIGVPTSIGAGQVWPALRTASREGPPNASSKVQTPSREDPPSVSSKQQTAPSDVQVTSSDVQAASSGAQTASSDAQTTPSGAQTTSSGDQTTSSGAQTTSSGAHATSSGAQTTSAGTVSHTASLARAGSTHAETKPPAIGAQLHDAKPATSPEEIAYNDAWSALRANDFRKAALGFARVVALSPAGPLADDAAYWRAVSLARAARGSEAIAAFRELLDDYPSSPRSGEASVMLGWLLVDANDLGEAERRFRAAASDPSQSVRTSARSGLDALAAKRH